MLFYHNKPFRFFFPVHVILCTTQLQIFTQRCILKNTVLIQIYGSLQIHALSMQIADLLECQFISILWTTNADLEC